MGRSDRTKPNDDHGDLRWQMRSHHRRKRSSSRGESVLVVVRARGESKKMKVYKHISGDPLSMSCFSCFFFSLAVRLVRSGQRGKNKTLLGIAASCRLPPPRWRLHLTLQEILRSKRRKKIHKFCGASQKAKTSERGPAIGKCAISGAVKRTKLTFKV